MSVGRDFTLDGPRKCMICSMPYCCELFSMRFSKSVCTQVLSAATSSSCAFESVTSDGSWESIA